MIISPKIVLALLLSFYAMLLAQAHATSNIAEELNRRYLNIVEQCSDGGPLYECSGVMVRVTKGWVPSKEQYMRNAVAFSFLRADTGIRYLHATGPGFIINRFKAGTSDYLMRVRCAFSIDGHTNYRTDGCNKVFVGEDPQGSSRPCAEQGIEDVEAWKAYLVVTRGMHCSFAADTKHFKLSMDARHHFPDENPLLLGIWNEVVIAPWSMKYISLLPIEAFFYRQGQSELEAQEMQLDFYYQTGRIIPVVKINLEAVSPQLVFSYNPADQTVPKQKVIDYEDVPYDKVDFTSSAIRRVTTISDQPSTTTTDSNSSTANRRPGL